MVGGSQQIEVDYLKDNPRWLGKGWVRLVGSSPSKTESQGPAAEAGFTSSSGGVRASSVTRRWNWEM